MLIYMLFSFLGAFCSIGYQITTSLLISDLIKNEVLGFHLTVGIFLFGLTLGSMWHNFDVEVPKTQLLKKFLTFEILLAITGLITILMIYGLYAFIYTLTSSHTTHLIYFLSAALPLIFALGFFSGIEIPIIIALGSKEKTGLLLGVNYIGGLLSSLLVPYFLGKTLNFYQLQSFFILANIFLFFLISLNIKNRSLLVTSVFAFILILATHALNKSSISLEQAFLKIHYMGIKIDTISASSLQQIYKLVKSSPDIVHTRSAYQTIDFIDEKNGLTALTAPPFTLYLNRDPQFSKDTWLAYHESMAVGAFNLSKKNHFKKLLIIGGGDGLLAHVLLKRYDNQIDAIDLVEIDPTIVKLSLDYLPLRKINQSALTSNKFTIFYEDAFKFIRESDSTYDGIFIDLPYPNSFELLRLYSYEFYSALSKRLNPDAFVLMDAPIWWPLNTNEINRPLPQDVLFSTLKEAGFNSLFAYGPIEPFIFLKTERESIRFSYDNIPEWISNRSFMNLTDMPIISDNVQIKKQYINSIFRPQKLRY